MENNIIEQEFKESMENLAKWIRVERQKAKLSQVELSSKAGLSQNHLYAIETGHRYPNMLTFFKICKALELHPGKFFGSPPSEERQQDLETIQNILSKYL